HSRQHRRGGASDLVPACAAPLFKIAAALPKLTFPRHAAPDGVAIGLRIIAPVCPLARRDMTLPRGFLPVAHLLGQTLLPDLLLVTDTVVVTLRTQIGIEILRTCRRCRNDCRRQRYGNSYDGRDRFSRHRHPP